MDEEEFQRLLDSSVGTLQGQQPQGEPQASPEVPQPDAAATATPAPTKANPQAPAPGMVQYPDGRWGPSPDPATNALGDPTGLDAAFGGALKSTFETKDFFFGDTPADQQSGFRRSVEETVDLRKQQSIVDGFTAGIAQFATGMIGLGKIKMLGTLAGSSKKVKAAVEIGKAATVGAVAFDPHEERLSNLIQQSPLANPITGYLAADPSDSAAEGRLKAAMESIGLDLAIIGVTTATLKAFKAAKRGDTKAAQAELDGIQKEAENAQVQGSSENAVEPPAQSGGEGMAEPSSGGIQGVEPEVPSAAQPEGSPSGQAGESVPGSVPQAEVQNADAAGQPQVVRGISEATAQEGLTPQGLSTPSAAPKVDLSVENTEEVLKNIRADADAMEHFGEWSDAIMFGGHTFAKGEGIPYRLLTSDGEVNSLMARLSAAAEEELDKIKGGDVLTDATVQKRLEARVRAFGEDPAAVIGMIQSSGANAKRLVADAETGMVLSQRMFMDAASLAQRINMGDYTEFGSRAAAIDAVKSRFNLAASVYGSTRSIVSNAARTVRRQRFEVDPKLVEKLMEADGEDFLKSITAAGNNPAALRKLAANPSLLTKVRDHAQFLYLNNLLSGPITHFINTASNVGMLTMRPLERMIGSAPGALRGQAESQQIFMESARQFGYMSASFGESFKNAVEALLKNDSVMAPQATELYNRGNTVPVLQRGTGYRPLNSLNNVMYNTYLTATTAVSAPATRTLGVVDELVKQTVYRSKLQARAHTEALLEASTQGLKGEAKDRFVKGYVKKALDDGFDAQGRALNPEALREAQITSFQQELVPGSLGRGVQTFVNNWPAAKFVLPFVKTPTNILRYGWKMTPGLNLLQKEFRGQLLGEMGAEAKAQAMGQFSLGITFLGTAATLAASGAITGGGPRDPKLLRELQATGWRPYSFVKKGADGKVTYVPFNRYDPLAMPFGIVADIQDYMQAQDREDDQTIGAAMGGLAIALAKQFTSKTYLTGLKTVVDALNDPDRSLGNFGANMGANFVPFASAQRQLNPDPYMREARDLADKVQATIPGLSENVPPRYNALGEPVLARKGLWNTEDENFVDGELQRLAIQGGSSLVGNNPNQNGVDLRDLTLSTGQNAFERYQQLTGKPSASAKPLREVVLKVMNSKAYQRAPDGDVDVKGTKLWILSRPVQRYREAALKQLKRDPVIREAFTKETLKVRDAYRTQRAQEQGVSMKRLGDAFGQDLTPNNQE